jgi:hypothetical protein
MFSVSVREGDILHCGCDLLVLKHADGFYGVDSQVAQVVRFEGTVPEGTVRVIPGGIIEAKRIAFIGVGPLTDFDYSKIREFGRRALEVAARQPRGSAKVCMPIHGPGYGLDEAEAFSSLVAGIVDAAADQEIAKIVKTVEIVELNPSRARRFDRILKALVKKTKNISEELRSDDRLHGENLLSAHRVLGKFGAGSQSKTRLFVAMPFKDEFNDEWEISIQEAANSLEILCERIDKSAFVGDISTEIKRRIEQYDGLIALLNDANPNVFLEIGYAWAKNKPTLLLAKDGQQLPFDVKGQRCIFYKGIADLRTKLKSELDQLQAQGVFRRA